MINKSIAILPDKGIQFELADNVDWPMLLSVLKLFRTSFTKKTFLKRNIRNSDKVKDKSILEFGQLICPFEGNQSYQ